MQAGFISANRSPREQGPCGAFSKGFNKRESKHQHSLLLSKLKDPLFLLGSENGMAMEERQTEFTPPAIVETPGTQHWMHLSPCCEMDRKIV